MDDQSKQKPLHTVAAVDHDSYSSGPEVWKRLPRKVYHDNGKFAFRTFPDTGSVATLISADLAKCESMVTTREKLASKFINVSGDIVPTEGIVPVKLKAGTNATTSKAIVSSTIKNEVIVGRADLQRLNVIPKQFPAPIMVISEEWFAKHSRMRDQLIRNNPTVLTDELPTESMEGCVIKIHLTPGEKQPFRISTARQVPLTGKKKRSGANRA